MAIEFNETENNTVYLANIYDEKFNPEEDKGWGVHEIVTGVVSDIKDAIDAAKKYSDFMKKFGEDPGSAILEKVMDFLKLGADVLQTIANKVQTLVDGIPGMDFSLCYNYSQLKGETYGNNLISGTGEENTEYTVLDKYTKVGNPSTGPNRQKNFVTIDNNIDEFSRATNIPVIPVDIYGMAFEKIDLLNVDFFNIYKKDSKSTVWNSLNDIFSAIVHTTLYLSAGVLLSTLIYHGINIILKRRDNPVNRLKNIEGIHRFFISLVILVVVVFLMIVCTTLSHYLMELIKGENTQEVHNSNNVDELPIRVNVEGVYSFSTNITGYIRFMSDSNEISRKVMYTIEYIILVICNCFMTFCMFYRMIKMWILGMLGPAIAAINALDMQEKVRFKITLKDWVKSYVLLTSAQIVLTGFYALIEFALFNK